MFDRITGWIFCCLLVPQYSLSLILLEQHIWLAWIQAAQPSALDFSYLAMTEITPFLH